MNLREIVSPAPVIAAIPALPPALAVSTARALLSGGLRVLEVNLHGTHAIASIDAIRKELPDMTVGVNALTKAADFAAAGRLGVHFGVTAGWTTELAAATRGARFPVMPGVMTPSDVVAAQHAGCKLMALYPADLAGGVRMLKLLGDDFPDLEFYAAGGISKDQAPQYLALPKVLCVRASWLAAGIHDHFGGLDRHRVAGARCRIAGECAGREMTEPEDQWPVLDWSQWQSCGDTLHMLMQIVGKTRLALTPMQNHWWNVPLYVTARGLSTSVMSLPQGGRLEIEFDFRAQRVTFRHSAGRTDFLPLRSQPVAEFYSAYKKALEDLGAQVPINPAPVEVADGIRFDQDTLHRHYDAEAAQRFWQVLSHADRLLKKFSTRFYGKISPVHFFWGSFDLAVTRFNGRRAPPRPGADSIQAEAYSHECISAGFWPGNGGFGRAAFFTYAAPVPTGLSEAVIPSPGTFDKTLGEFILEYDALRAATDPDAVLLDFLQSAYGACADAAGWDRASLDRSNT